MTVSDAIDALKTFPQDLPLFAADTEDGAYEISSLSLTTVEVVDTVSLLKRPFVCAQWVKVQGILAR